MMDPFRDPDDPDTQDPRPGPPYFALVVAVRVRPGTSDQDLMAHIVHGSEFLIDDIEQSYASRAAHESLGDPPGPGIWVWIGNLHTIRDEYNGDADVEWRGEYRPATDVEIAALRDGTNLWDVTGVEGWKWLPLEEDIVLQDPLFVD
jgi:hypothetical protein